MIQAAWRAVECTTCGAGSYVQCHTLKATKFMGFDFYRFASHPHVARIAAGKAKRKGRHTGGRNKA